MEEKASKQTRPPPILDHADDDGYETRNEAMGSDEDGDGAVDDGAVDEGAVNEGAVDDGAVDDGAVDDGEDDGVVNDGLVNDGEDDDDDDDVDDSDDDDEGQVDPDDPGENSEASLDVVSNRGSAVPRVRITSAGEDKYWMEHTRKAVAQCAPSNDKQFMLYLPLTPTNTGSKLLIASDINLQEMALSRGGPAEYSLARAFNFNQHHRKAKSQLNRTIVKGFTEPESAFLMVLNVMNGNNGPMTLSPDLHHLGSIEGLRQVLNSDKMYTDKKVHEKWVGLFASGTVYGSVRAQPQDRLDEMIDVDYEAHARYEMWSRLSCQGWRHGYTAKLLAERSQGFRAIRKLVRKDRLDNLKAAEFIRLGSTVSAHEDLERTQSLESGGLADTTDEEDNF